MPQIPVSRNRIQARTLQPGRVSTSIPSTQANYMQSLQIGNQIIDKLDRIVQRETERAESTELDGYSARLRQRQNEQLHDKDRGFYRLSGKNAIESFSKYSEDYQKFVKEEENKLGSERLKQKARKISERYLSDYDVQLNRHTGAETEKYENNQFSANMKSIDESAALKYNEVTDVSSLGDPKAVHSLYAEKMANVDSFAARKGLGGDQLKQLRLQASSSFHESVVKSALNKNEYNTAKEYYNRIKGTDAIDQDTSIRLEKMVRGTEVRGESQRITDEIILEDLSLGESLERARAVKDPEIRDATVTRVKNRYNEMKLVKAENQKREFDDVISQLEQFGTVDHLPPEQLDQLTEKKKNVLKKVQSLISQGYQPKSDPIVFNDLYTKATTPELSKKFLTEDINEYAHKLSISDRKKLLSLQADIRLGKNVEKIRRTASNNDMVDTALAEMLIENKTKNDKARRGRFKRLAFEKIDAWEQENKRDISDKEARQIIDDLTLKVQIEGTFWDSEKRLFEAEEEDVIVGIEYDDIPLKDKELIKEQMRQLNIPFSEEAAAKIFSDTVKKRMK